MRFVYVADLQGGDGVTDRVQNRTDWQAATTTAQKLSVLAKMLRLE